MGLLDKLKAHMDAERTYRKVKDAEDPYNIEERQKKRDETKVTRIDFTYNKADDCYEQRCWTKERLDSVPWLTSVHVSGKKRTYFHTDIWDELVWAEGGQSAIHDFIWANQEKMDVDKIMEKKPKSSDLDLKKIGMIIGAIIVIFIVVTSMGGR